jgi:hypothetical protein
MRVEVGKTLRVGPGDEVVVRANMSPAAKLGRLFVFASENGAQFSPYVPNVASMIVTENKPAMLPPVMLRLTEARPTRRVSFVSDIDGFVRVMQEVDSADDPKVAVRLSRRINPELGWIDWLERKFTSWQTPKRSPS